MAINNEKKIVSRPSTIINSALLAKCGLDVDISASGAKAARAALEQSGIDKNNIPTNGGSDIAVCMADAIRASMAAAEGNKKATCLMLGMLADSGEYKKANAPDGKPFASMAAYARVLLPELATSTVLEYQTVGTRIYLPAAQGKFGKASALIMAQNPTNLTPLKAALSSDNQDMVDLTIDALKAASKECNRKSEMSKPVSQATTKAIARVIKSYFEDKDATKAVKGVDVIRAAKGDTPTLQAYFPALARKSKPSGETAQVEKPGAQSVDAKVQEDRVFAQLCAYIPQNPANKEQRVIIDANSLRGMIERTVTGKNELSAETLLRAFVRLLK